MLTRTHGRQTGNCLASFKLTGNAELSSTDHDFEDISIGPGPDPSMDYLYLGEHRPPFASFVRWVYETETSPLQPAAILELPVLPTKTWPCRCTTTNDVRTLVAERVFA